MFALFRQIFHASVNFRRRAQLVAGFVGLPVVITIMAVLIIHTTAGSNRLNYEVRRPSLLRDALHAILLALKDAESSERGYILTGSDAYLDPYKQTAQTLPRMLAQLDTMAMDEPQRQAIAKIHADASGKLAQLAAAIALYQSGDHEGAKPPVKISADMHFMRDLRPVAARLDARLGQEVAARVELRQRRLQNAMIGVRLLFAILLAFLITTVLAVAANLRERERGVKQLAHAKQEADAANRAKSEFLANMSHELRTPLNAILGFSEVIMRELFGPIGMRKYVDYAHDVHKSGEHLLELIDDVLDLSKIDAGKMEMRESEIAIGPLIEDAVSLVSGRARGRVSLEIQSVHGLPYLLADQRLIKQILLNLLSNAIKFTPPGGRVVIGASHREHDGIRIHVTDSGIGMSVKEIDKALTPYGQIDSKVAGEHKGAGLGLPISRSLCLLHGGNLMIDSAPGVGTTIIIAMPPSRARWKLTESLESPQQGVAIAVHAASIAANELVRTGFK